MSHHSPDSRTLTKSAMIAALYCALTLLLHPISYGSVQLRAAEALTLLPVLTPAAVPGLAVGCLLANLLGGCSIIDIIFGSLTTLAAAALTRRLRAHPVLAALPPVLLNALVVGSILSATARLPLLVTILWIGLGEMAACLLLGLPLLWALNRSGLDRLLK